MRVISYYSDTVCDFIWTCPFHFVLLYCVMYCCVVLYFVLFHSVSFSCILSTLPINKHAMLSFLTTQWRQQSLSEDKFQPRSFFQVLKRCVTNYYNCWGSCQSLIETFVIRRAAWPRPSHAASTRVATQFSWVELFGRVESSRGYRADHVVCILVVTLFPVHVDRLVCFDVVWRTHNQQSTCYYILGSRTKHGRAWDL